MKMNEIKKQLIKFYRVSEKVLEPENCLITKIRNERVSICVDLGGIFHLDVFRIKDKKLVLSNRIRPKGEENKALFLPEY